MMKNMRLLVTGGLGFIGSNYVRMMLERFPSRTVYNLDGLTYAGNPDNLKDLQGMSNYHFIQEDVCSPKIEALLKEEKIDTVVHFAAESHVDRSITDPGAFVRTNVLGTHNMLEASRRADVSRFVLVSTDEVYGSLGPAGLFTEATPLAPNSPYSSSKAGGDLIGRAYFHTYGFPVITTRCSNNYGPYQYPEKLIPTIITNAMRDKEIPVYGDGLNVRDWLYVEDHCEAIDLVLHEGRPGEVYNIGGNNESTNLDIVKRVLRELGKPESLITFVADRLGHDRRYGIDASKMRQELGWQPSHDLDEGLRQTIRWYEDNASWWKKLLDHAEGET